MRFSTAFKWMGLSGMTSPESGWLSGIWNLQECHLSANKLESPTIRLLVLCVNAQRHRDFQSHTYNDVSPCSISRRLRPLMEGLQGESNPLYQMSLLQTGIWRWCCKEKQTLMSVQTWCHWDQPTNSGVTGNCFSSSILFPGRMCFSFLYQFYTLTENVTFPSLLP